MLAVRICTGCLALLVINASSGFVAQNVDDSRAPFVLELPDISDRKYVAPVVRIAAKAVPTIKIRLVEPYSSRISYGKTVITLNGSGINRGCTQSRDGEGKVYTCQENSERLGGYVIGAGKNVLEVAANDGQRDYYASFVLLLGEPKISNFKEPVSQERAERFTGRKFAMVVGVSNYKFQDAGLNNLDFADDDARAIAAFLSSPEGGRFLPADMKLLIDGDASVSAIRAAMNDIARRATANDLVFIFIAGHGAPDPLSAQNLYFLLHDSKVVDMSGTAFPMTELKRYLDTQVTAQRVIVMIDTCHSAGVNQKTRTLVTGRDLGRDGDENNISNFYISNQLFKDRGRAVLTSSDVNEVSQESKKWDNHGVFTWAMLEGLRGGADFNGDNLVTTGELFRFTRSRVQTSTNFQQNPISLPGSASGLALATVKDVRPAKGSTAFHFPFEF